MKRLAVISGILAVLAGCTTAPPGNGINNSPHDYVRCDVPVTRDAGMNVRVEGCAVWTIGPPRFGK